MDYTVIYKSAGITEKRLLNQQLRGLHTKVNVPTIAFLQSIDDLVTDNGRDTFPSEVAAWMGATPSVITYWIRKALNYGWVNYDRPPGVRQATLTLTVEGKILLEEAHNLKMPLEGGE